MKIKELKARLEQFLAFSMTLHLRYPVLQKTLPPMINMNTGARNSFYDFSSKFTLVEKFIKQLPDDDEEELTLDQRLQLGDWIFSANSESKISTAKKDKHFYNPIVCEIFPSSAVLSSYTKEDNIKASFAIYSYLKELKNANLATKANCHAIENAKNPKDVLSLILEFAQKGLSLSPEMLASAQGRLVVNVAEYISLYETGISRGGYPPFVLTMNAVTPTVQTTEEIKAATPGL